MSGLLSMLSVAGDRFTTNLRGSLVNMSPEKWIRVVIVVGAYMLLRPYLMRLGAWAQLRAHERDAEPDEAAAKAEMSPNALRGQVKVPDDTDDDDDDPDHDDHDRGGGTASGTADWGKKARRRQRQMIRTLIDAQEKRLQESREEEEDKDIEEFLIKE